MELPLKGGCACGAVRYECSAMPLGMGNCHCRDCQYASGTSHSSVLSVPARAVSIKGEPQYFETVSNAGVTVRRGFCKKCGSPLFSMSEAGEEFMAIKAASLDDPTCFEPSIDTWTSSAQPWCVFSPTTQKLQRA